MTLKQFQHQLRTLLSPAEARLLKKLSSPQRIQDYLDHFPVNFGNVAGEPIIQSPHNAIVAKKFHCMEGAVLAAFALAYHGQEPLLMDLQSRPDDYDHVVALFKVKGHWGAISKTNYPTLRWRDPVYKTPRELAMSYFHEYFLWIKSSSGTKTMRAFSAPFSLTRYNPKRIWAARDLDWLAEILDDVRHYPAVPKGVRPRPTSLIEARTMEHTEWSKRGVRNKR